MTQDKTHKVPNVPPLRFPEFTGEWEKCKLENIIHVQGGYAFQSEKFQTIGVPIIRISNLPQDSNTIDLTECVYYENGNYDNFIVQKGDLLIAMSGATTGKTAIYKGDEKAFCNQRVGLFRLKDKKLYYKFLYPFVESESFANQLNSKLVAGAQPNISSKDIEDISISLPQIIEQQKLSRLLELITQRIATQNKIIQHLESLIKGICKMLLAKQGNTFIKDCLVCNSSTLQESSVLPCGKYPVYGATGISGYLDVPQVEHDAILIIKDGAGVGNVRYATDKHGVIGTLNYLSAKNGYNLKYLYYCLRIFNFTPFVTGLAIPHIYFRDYGSSKIYCPSLTEQKHIANNLSNIERKIENEKQLLEKLKEQKKYLLSQMFI